MGTCKWKNNFEICSGLLKIWSTQPTLSSLTFVLILLKIRHAGVFGHIFLFLKSPVKSITQRSNHWDYLTVWLWFWLVSSALPIYLHEMFPQIIANPSFPVTILFNFPANDVSYYYLKRGVISVTEMSYQQIYHLSYLKTWEDILWTIRILVLDIFYIKLKISQWVKEWGFWRIPNFLPVYQTRVKLRMIWAIWKSWLSVENWKWDTKGHTRCKLQRHAVTSWD